eukprot:GHVO01067175.1.p2 GENE.GHVO01067175.1~~GHVO01067175.1.p2  ORF type:complete len:160 (+),score=20.31 GHVO01067175.1:203-682(+)
MTNKEFSKKQERLKRMMPNEEKIKILKKYFTSEDGGIDLSEINFGDVYVNLSGIQATTINNSGQEAEKTIYNKYQKSKYIDNDYQEAKEIYNEGQKAETTIHNGGQEAKYIHNDYQRAKDIRNEGQEAKDRIDNDHQEAKEIYNEGQEADDIPWTIHVI